MTQPVRSFARVLGLVLFVAVLATGPVGGPGHAAEQFVEGFEDLPLMPGLRNVPAAGVAFDAAAGRVVVAFAEGALSLPAVQAFYAETLPQLGWRAAGLRRWRREGEQLTLDAVVETGGLVVRFELAPH